MKHFYQACDFTPKSLGIIAQANEIIEEYSAQGFSLTLRQIYYQFVARGFIPNNNREYHNLGCIIDKARLAGLIDWDMIEDRTRSVRGNAHWDSPSGIVDSCAYQYRRWLWSDQDFYVEVWIEKDALVGVIDGVCRDWDINFFSCRGYTSQSAMYRAAQRILLHDRPCVILHLGDHDPSGLDMTRDIGDRLQLLTEGADIEVKRIALNMDQVDEYEPPPNPTKFTDSRRREYVARWGSSSWELDALDPSVLVRLINDELMQVVNLQKFDRQKKKQEVERKILEKVAKDLKKDERNEKDRLRKKVR
jgi:hypothetical protein